MRATTRATAAGGSATVGGRSQSAPRLYRALRAVRSNAPTLAGLVIVAGFAVMAILAPKIAPYDPRQQSMIERLHPPSVAHVFGTDEYGRDVYSRVVFGARVSLAVAVGSILTGGTAGTILGMFAGLFGGRFDSTLSAVVDMLLSFPNLMLGLLFVVVFGTGLLGVIGAISLSLVPRFVRVSRGPTLSVREREYIEASRAMGAAATRTVFRHVLPNILGPVVVSTSLWMASAILLEANLSFLGLGVAPPTPTWGNMIRDGTVVMFRAPWLAICPGLAIMAAVMAFNLLGDGLRDALDPRET